MIWIPTLGVKCLPCLRRLNYSSNVSSGLLRPWNNCMARDCPPKKKSASCVACDDPAGATSPRKTSDNHAWIPRIFEECWCRWRCSGISWGFSTPPPVSPSWCRHRPPQQGDQSLAGMSLGVLSQIAIQASPGFWREYCFLYSREHSSMLQRQLRCACPLGG